MNIKTAQIKNKLDSNERDCIIVILDNDIQMSIPFDQTNADYQAYLKWVEESNKSIPADK
jgi:hypothetical protein